MVEDLQQESKADNDVPGFKTEINEVDYKHLEEEE